MYKNVSEFESAIDAEEEPPTGIEPHLKALWLIRKNRWDDAHDLVSTMETKLSSRIHGLLHTIEGDLHNAAYWFDKAEAKGIRPDDIAGEWLRIANEIIEET